MLPSVSVTRSPPRSVQLRPPTRLRGQRELARWGRGLCGESESLHAEISGAVTTGKPHAGYEFASGKAETGVFYAPLTIVAQLHKTSVGTCLGGADITVAAIYLYTHQGGIKCLMFVSFWQVDYRYAEAGANILSFEHHHRGDLAVRFERQSNVFIRRTGGEITDVEYQVRSSDSLTSSSPTLLWC